HTGGRGAATAGCGAFRTNLTSSEKADVPVTTSATPESSRPFHNILAPRKCANVPRRRFPNARSVSYADRRIRTLSQIQKHTRLKLRLGLIYTFERTCMA